MRKLKHRWVDINKALHRPVSVFMLQDHQPDSEPVQWGAYIKDGNKISLSSNCDITVTKKKIDCKAIRKIMYGE